MAEDTIKRVHHGSDAFMLEKSEELQEQFLLDVADFTAFDTELDAAFGGDWLDAINAALEFESDDLIVSQQEGKTAIVISGMQACSEAYIDIIYFAEKAFKNNRPVLREFGQGAKYKTATKSQSKMVDFMDELYKTATKYSLELAAKGCPPGTIAAIQTVGNAYRSSNTTQNLFIDNRPVISQDRVILLNTAYGFMSTVVSAAERVYRTNPAKLHFYSYNPPSGSNNNDVVLEMDLLGFAIGNIDLSIMDGKSFELAIFEASGSNVSVFAGPSAGSAPNPPLLNIPVNVAVEKTPEEIAIETGFGPALPFLNTQNTGAAAAHLTITFTGVTED
jgi:hypothetical protein